MGGPIGSLLRLAPKYNLPPWLLLLAENNTTETTTPGPPRPPPGVPVPLGGPRGAQDVQDGARGEGRGRGGARPGRGGVAVGRRRRSRGHGGVMEVRLRDRRSADAISNEPA